MVTIAAKQGEAHHEQEALERCNQEQEQVVKHLKLGGLKEDIVAGNDLDWYQKQQGGNQRGKQEKGCQGTVK